MRPTGPIDDSADKNAEQPRGQVTTIRATTTILPGGFTTKYQAARGPARPLRAPRRPPRNPTNAVLAPVLHRLFTVAPTNIAATLVGLAAALTTTVTHAAEKARRGVEERNLTAELGVGVLGLPGARVCGNGRSLLECNEGDTTPMAQIWELYRASELVAVGAGISLGMSPFANNTQGDPEGVEREHNRGYLTAEGLFRYHVLIERPWECWLGATSGLAVVSDTFRSRRGTTDRAFVGPRGTTLRTEGLSLGVAVGLNYLLSPSWTVGASMRTGVWLLPSQRAVDPFGDQASLRGVNSFLMLAISVGYRTRL